MMQRKVLKMQQLWKPENIETEVYIAFCFLSSLSFGSLSFLKEMLQALAVCIFVCPLFPSTVLKLLLSMPPRILFS